MKVKTLIITLILLFTVSQASACLIEYRVVTFDLKNKSQVVSEDFAIMNIENPYNFTISNISVTYRNATFNTSVLAPNCTTGGIRKDLNVKLFKINLSYSLKGNSNKFELRLKVKNNYPFEVPVKIEFPKPDWLINCINCKIEGNDVVYESTLKAKSCGCFVMVGRGKNVKLENGKIEFRLNKSALMNFTPSIPISILKMRKNGKWHVKFMVCNPSEMNLSVIMTGYINKSKPPHLLNNSTVLFTVRRCLKKGECLIEENDSSSISPGFFVKVTPVASVVCGVCVYPATKVSTHYIQYGEIKGLSLSLPAPTGGGGMGGGGGGNFPPNTQTSRTQTNSPVTPNQPKTRPNQPVTPVQPITPIKPGKLPRKQSKIPLVFPVKSKVIEKTNIMGFNINRVKMNNVVTLIMTVIPLIQSSVILMILPIMRKITVFDRADFTVDEIESITGFIYAPLRCDLGRVLPLNLSLVQPDKEMVRDIHEIYDIPLVSAEAIVIALQYEAPVYLSDMEFVDVAHSLGVEAYYKPKGGDFNGS